MIIIRHEKSEDLSAIRKVHEAAFDTSAEADLVDALRDNHLHILSLVVVQNNQILGHILFTPVTIEPTGSHLSILGLAPMAVLPAHQRKGVGSRLVKAGLNECLSNGYCAVVVLGHPDYYRRFGFIPSVEYSLTCKYDVPPEVFMVKELRKGVLTGYSGIVKYHSDFDKV
jgi:putative acetyltransferase